MLRLQTELRAKVAQFEKEIVELSASLKATQSSEDKLLSQMESRGLQPTSHTYSAAISACPGGHQ